MFININSQLLLTTGKSFLNSALLDNPIDFFPNKATNSLLDKILIHISTKRRQRYIRNILLEEFFYLYLEFKSKQKKIENILNKGNINHLRKDLQSNPKKYPAYLSYSLDYLIDEYEIDIFNGEKQINIDDISLALSFIELREVLFYVLMNTTDLQFKNNTISITPTKESYKLLKQRWLATSWDKSSFYYNGILNHKIFMIGYKISSINNYIFHLSNHLLDRVFYFNKKYINNKYFEQDAFTYMQQLCTFFAYLLYGYYSQSKIHIKNNKRFEQLGINNSFLLQIINENSLKTNLNKGFKVNGNNIFFIDGTSYEYVMRMYFDDYLKSKKRISFNTEKGKIFEEYIFNYINKQRDKFSNYEITMLGETTFIDKSRGKTKTLDIDLVLFDKERQKYFLIQAKHALYAKAYLKEEVHHYCNNKTLIKKGINQLNTFKYFYNKDDELKDYFTSKGLDNINLENTHLLLLHTMPIFDFLQIGEVILYDWNSFRNLLEYGLRLNTSQNLYGENFITQSDKILEIEKLDNTIDYLLDSTIRDKKNNLYLKDEYNYFIHLFNYIQTIHYTIEFNIK